MDSTSVKKKLFDISINRFFYVDRITNDYSDFFELSSLGSESSRWIKFNQSYLFYTDIKYNKYPSGSFGSAVIDYDKSIQYIKLEINSSSILPTSFTRNTNVTVSYEQYYEPENILSCTAYYWNNEY